MNLKKIQLNALRFYNTLTEMSERTNKKVNFVTNRIPEQLQLIREGDKR